MRVFAALDISEVVRAAIGSLIEKLRPACPAARWVRIEAIHLTLKFIGDVGPEKIDPVKASLSRIQIANLIELNFRNVGFFPDEHRPRVFWAGIEAGPELAALAAAIEASLEPLGIAKEQRSFSPHLTLARFDALHGRVASADLDRLLEAISKAGTLAFGSASASEFHLYQSVLKPGGAEYTRQATFRFAGGESR